MRIIGASHGVVPTESVPDTKSQPVCKPTTRVFEGYRSGASAIPKAPPINKGSNIGRKK
jgi:hypothetical protein